MTADAPPATSRFTDPELEAALIESRPRRHAEYLELLRIPSISTLPEHAADCRAAAEWISARLTAAGLEHAEVATTTGRHPIVYADWLHAEGAPTVVVYAHYDVQPVDPLDEWTSPPFEPAIEGDRVLARGSSDDKGNLMILIQTAEALLATRGRLPVNLRFVLEGEEESGSESLPSWFASNRARLTGDVAIISDVGLFEGDQPAITVGLRGLLGAEIHVNGPFQDVHSGTYGGQIENPANALAAIIAGLKGPDGRVRIPGFYDDVEPLTEADRAAIAALPFDEAAYRESLGVPALVGEVGYSTLERRAVRPTLDVNGIWGGFSGHGSKTIIPARAGAKITCRLVPDQDPERIFEQLRAYVLEIVPPGVLVEVLSLGTGKPSRTPLDHPATAAAARAIEAIWGVGPLYIREGGSIPFVAQFQETLGLPVVLLGFTPPGGNFHAPNEWMDMRYYEAGIRTMARYWDELAIGQSPPLG
jgi:acetylornithine deacetylase/succinyl-diaminopimelate desuccinylase-like protein